MRNLIRKIQKILTKEPPFMTKVCKELKARGNSWFWPHKTEMLAIKSPVVDVIYLDPLVHKLRCNGWYSFWRWNFPDYIQPLSWLVRITSQDDEKCLPIFALCFKNICSEEREPPWRIYARPIYELGGGGDYLLAISDRSNMRVRIRYDPKCPTEAYQKVLMAIACQNYYHFLATKPWEYTEQETKQ